MIELNKKDFEIKKIKEDLSSEAKNNEALASKSSEEIMTRPDVVDAKVYKLKVHL